jgi:hypothetical protein
LRNSRTNIQKEVKEMATYNKVQVEQKNAGTYIDWSQSKTKLTFGDDDLTVNCATRQREQDQTYDICYDSEQNLVIGASGTGARRYVAQIFIPGFQYDETEGTETYTDENGEEQTRSTVIKTKLDLDMADVVLTLWSID